MGLKPVLEEDEPAPRELSTCSRGPRRIAPGLEQECLGGPTGIRAPDLVAASYHGWLVCSQRCRSRVSGTGKVKRCQRLLSRPRFLHEWRCLPRCTARARWKGSRRRRVPGCADQDYRTPHPFELRDRDQRAVGVDHVNRVRGGESELCAIRGPCHRLRRCIHDASDVRAVRIHDEDLGRPPDRDARERDWFPRPRRAGERVKLGARSQSTSRLASPEDSFVQPHDFHSTDFLRSPRQGNPCMTDE